MSKRQPSRCAVRLIPPTTVSASRIVDARPCLLNWYAAVRPAGPAPMMRTSGRDKRALLKGTVVILRWSAGPTQPGTSPLGHEHAREDEDRVAGKARAEDDEQRPLHFYARAQEREADGERKRAHRIALERLDHLGAE